VRALVYGLAVAGASTVRALQRRGVEVVVADDRDRRRQGGAVAADLGVELVTAPTDPRRSSPRRPGLAVARRPRVAPGGRRGTAAGASRCERDRARLPVGAGAPGRSPADAAVTGTDGKTTTTLLMVAILPRPGCAPCAGNTEVPLVDAIETEVDALRRRVHELPAGLDRAFRADAAVWLNLAEDHLDWHRSMDTYEAAKARIFELQRPDDVAIGFVTTRSWRRFAGAPGADVTFGHGRRRLPGPRRLTHGSDGTDRRRRGDAAGACPTTSPTRWRRGAVLETGLATPDDVSAERSPRSPARPTGSSRRGHRRRQWYDDSKATTPHAASVAIRAFDRSC
jgi:UDP-N-acetylmuramoylalanine--D-glutamate ligase